MLTRVKKFERAAYKLEGVHCVSLITMSSLSNGIDSLLFEEWDLPKEVVMEKLELLPCTILQNTLKNCSHGGLRFDFQLWIINRGN